MREEHGSPSPRERAEPGVRAHLTVRMHALRLASAPPASASMALRLTLSGQLGSTPPAVAGGSCFVFDGLVETSMDSLHVELLSDGIAAYAASLPLNTLLPGRRWWCGLDPLSSKAAAGPALVAALQMSFDWDPHPVSRMVGVMASTGFCDGAAAREVDAGVTAQSPPLAAAGAVARPPPLDASLFAESAGDRPPSVTSRSAEHDALSFERFCELERRRDASALTEEDLRERFDAFGAENGAPLSFQDYVMSYKR